MSLQKYPLLRFREGNPKQQDHGFSGATYDLASGLWLDKDHTPLIEKYLDGAQGKAARDSNLGGTTITRTREGVDRSESIRADPETAIDQEDIVASCLLFSTMTTKTRESIDRSESS